MKILFLMAISSLLLGSCAGGPELYNASYKAQIDQPTAATAYLLADGARPQLIFSDDIDADVEKYIRQNFVVVGESDFNGPQKKFGGAFKVARKLNVTHILFQAKYLYVGTKKAYKYYDHYDYIPVAVDYNGPYRRVIYDRVADPISVPYKKEFSIYNHRAIYLVKLK